MKTDLDRYASQFLDFLQYQRHYSDKTIESYHREIEHFKNYLKSELIDSYQEVSYQLLRGYLTKLYDKNLAKSSINHKLSALRSFYNYLLKEELVDDNPFLLIESQKTAKRNPDFLFVEEMMGFLDSIDTKNDLGIILRENMGEGHVIQVTSENGEISYVENPLINGSLPEGQKWVNAQDVEEEYILVDTENNSTVAGMGTIDNTKTEIDVQYASFGGQEYVKNAETYIGLPEGVDLEEAYEDFSEYYQFRLQQQEKQQEEQQKDTQKTEDYEIEP